jgi:hypothetical protein
MFGHLKIRGIATRYDKFANATSACFKDSPLDDPLSVPTLPSAQPGVVS